MTPHPERIAGYRIVRVLDPAPNFADVFLGEPEGGNAAGQVVIKWVRRLDSELEREVADREMKIGINLEHPNIARLLGYGTWGERPYLVTEYLAGGTLQSLIEREGPLAWQRTLEITAQVCSALGYAHSHQMLGTVVHRDLTPDNILFDASGQAKVIDYGIASAKFLPSKYGRSFAAMGKNRYMSLEQMAITEAGAATPAMDIFSLGAVLYEMLTKKLPYGDDAEAAAAQVAVLTGKQDTPGPKDLNPQIPEWLNHAVKQALSPDPATRWASVEEFSRALRLETLPEEKPPPVTPRTRPEPSPERDAPVKRPGRDQRSAERERIKEAERAAESCWDWIFVSRDWKTIGEDAEARRCLAQAERLTDYLLDWILVAQYWMEIFADGREARRCLTQAERVAESSIDWKIVAVGWMRVLADEREARRCLTQSERLAEFSIEWVSIAEGWKEAFGDHDGARRCLTQAEKVTRSLNEWAAIAEGWKEILGDGEARRCLARAEGVAGESFDWKIVADAWMEVLADGREARRCLTQAERVAESSIDWSTVAAGWMEILDDGREARRCLARAERVADHVNAWTAVAHGWVRVFHDKHEASRCLTQAEKLDNNWLNWHALADGWDDLGESERAAKCRRKAQI